MTSDGIRSALAAIGVIVDSVTVDDTDDGRKFVVAVLGSLNRGASVDTAASDAAVAAKLAALLS